MKRRLSVLSLALCTLLCLSACFTQAFASAAGDNAYPPAKTEVSYALFAFPQSLDPFYYTGTAAFLMNANINDSLMFSYMGNTNDIRPLIAESMTKSEDGLVYTFKLREGVKFQNGEPVTVDSVVYSYTRWKEAPLSKEASAVVAGIEADHANNSVTITVTSPVPSVLLQFATNVPIIPESVYGPNGSPDTAQPIQPMAAVGCGAYKVTQFIQDQIIVLEAIDDYYLEDVYLGGNPVHTRKIVYRFLPEQNSRMVAFLAGDVVSIPDPTAEDVTYYDALEKEAVAKGEFSPIRVESVESAYRHGLACNMLDPIVGARDGTPEEQERAANLRRAISSAVDRQALNIAEFNGYANDAVRQLAHSLTEGYLPNMPYYPYDVAKAKEYFALTGYDKDPNFKLTLKYMSDDKWSTAFAIVVQDCLRKVGITVELEGKMTAAHNEDVWAPTRNYQLTYMPYSPVVSAPDTAYRSPYYSTSGWNPFNFADPRVDELIDAARTELDTEKRIAMYEELNTIATQSLAFIPFLGVRAQTLISERWAGYFSSVATPYPKLFMMWWEDDGIWTANDGLPYLNGSDLTTYKVEHYKPNDDGTWADTPTDVVEYKGLNTGFGTTSAPANLYEGYVLNTAVSEYNLTIHPDGSTVARYYYTKASE